MKIILLLILTTLSISSGSASSMANVNNINDQYKNTAIVNSPSDSSLTNPISKNITPASSAENTTNIENSPLSYNQNLTAIECFKVTNNTIVCAIKPSSNLGTYISFFALIISFGGLLYTLRKDKKARVQSIEDDYWIRKIISPISLEPLIKKITETVSVIPDDLKSGNFDKKTCNKFGITFQSEWSQITASVDVLALLDKNVCITALEHVSNIEDEVLKYCSNNTVGVIGTAGGFINKSDLQAFMNTEMISIMDCIKQYQLSKI